MARRGVAADYSRTDIPRRYWDAEIAGCPSPQARKHCTGYLQDLKSNLESGVGRTFVGLPGTGKTTLACIIGMRAADTGVSVSYTTLAQYVRRLITNIELRQVMELHPEDIDTFAAWRANRERLLRLRNTTKLLIVDDVGKEHPTHTRFAEDEFDFLLRHRFDRGLSTVLTSNVRLPDWATRYSDALESFLAEAAPIVVMTTPKDLRRS